MSEGRAPSGQPAGGAAASSSAAWRDRESWLSLLEELLDPGTVERLEQVGVAPGWRALEVGAGKGSIAVWLARRVGSGGGVVATDTDLRFLDGVEEPNLEVLRHDVLADELPAESFDLVHCRALLVHLSEPERALERMVGWLRPGGALLVEEPWFDAGVVDPEVARAAQPLLEVMDGEIAGRLPHVLDQAGLERIEAEGRFALVKGATKLASLYRRGPEGRLEVLVAEGGADREALDRARAGFADPDWSGWGRPWVAAWGWKPAAGRDRAPEKRTSAGAWTVVDTAQSIPERLAEQAERHPAGVAIGAGSWQPSFSELDAASNRLAEALLERRGPGEGRVALLARHDAPLFVAALAALKAGKTAVVLNPTHPPARLGQIRAETEPELVLCDAPNVDLALRAGFSAGDLHPLAERPDGSPHPRPRVAVSPDDLAFLIYTSGSTGRPKGVMQTHRNVLHNVLRQTNGLGVRAGDRVALLASLGAGQGVGVTFTALLNGATLFPFPMIERGVSGLAPWLATERITVLSLSASIFRHFVRNLDGQRFPGVRLLRLGSEPALRADFDAFRRHFGEGCVLANLLSASEAGNIALSLLGPDSEVRPGTLPVGRPADGIEVMLLDEQGAEVRPGEVGELVVRSRYLSPGYWRDDELTGKHFTAPGTGAGGDGGTEAPLFRTGDLARLSSSGSLTVVGRGDTRVKVRGNRVELSEVEAAIAAAPEVAAAAVRASPTPRGDTGLTAFIALRSGEDLSAESLRRRLRVTLPRHSIPGAFLFLDALPLDANGKLDRERLAAIEVDSRPPRGLEPPRGETEELLAGIWADVFELERVGRTDDFFDLDGDSLLAAEVAAEVHDAFAVEIELDAFTEHRTLAAMARLVDGLRSEAPGDRRPPLVSAPRTAPLPASFEQERAWRHSRVAEEALYQNMTVAVRIRGTLDVGALRRGVDHLVRRHQILRTRFAERDGRLVQVVHPARPVELPLIEPPTPAAAVAAASALLAQEACTPFDLARGPLVRLSLVRVTDGEHLLLRSNHHIASDGPSWRVFFDELGLLYDAYRRDLPPPLGDDPPLQYGDFAAWERRSLRPQSRRYGEEVDWWRRRLEGVGQPVMLPFERPTMHPASASDGVIWWGLRPRVSRRLNRLGREAGATYYMVRLALLGTLLAADTERDDLLLLTFVSRRGPAELRTMFGPLFNPAFLRLRLAPEETFRQRLGRVRAAVAGTSAHVEIPHEELLRELRAQGSEPPGVQAVFSESLRLPPRRLANLEITTLKPHVESMPRGFSFSVDPRLEADGLSLTFDARFYDPAGAHDFVARFQRLAAAASRRPDRALGKVLAKL